MNLSSPSSIIPCLSSRKLLRILTRYLGHDFSRCLRMEGGQVAFNALLISRNPTAVYIFLLKFFSIWETRSWAAVSVDLLSTKPCCASLTQSPSLDSHERRLCKIFSNILLRTFKTLIGRKHFASSYGCRPLFSAHRFVPFSTRLENSRATNNC